MTGEVFAENSDFFFVFEPLLSIVPYQYLTTTDVCKMRNAECRFVHENLMKTSDFYSFLK